MPLRSLNDKDKAISCRTHPEEVPYREITSEDNLVKVSIVGAGMVSNPGVAAKMFEAIYDLGISIKMVTTSEITLPSLLPNRPGSRSRAPYRLRTGYGRASLCRRTVRTPLRSSKNLEHFEHPQLG